MHEGPHAVLLRALAKRPEARFATAAELPLVRDVARALVARDALRADAYESVRPEIVEAVVETAGRAPAPAAV